MKPIHSTLMILVLAIFAGGCHFYGSKKCVTIDDLAPEEYKDTPLLKDLVVTMQTKKRSVPGPILSIIGMDDPRLFDVLIVARNSNSVDENDENKYVRVYACMFLGMLEDERAIDPLIDSLRDKQWIVRQSSCLALSNFKDKRVVDMLIKMLDDESIFVKHAACEALGDIGDQRAVKPLRRMLENKSEYVRKNAQAALDKLEKKE